MHTALRHSLSNTAPDELCPRLEELLHETKKFLSRPDPSVEAWMEYGQKRASLFAHLQAMHWQVPKEKQQRVHHLIAEILRQDGMVREKAATTLTGMRADISMLAKVRQARRGYCSPSPVPLLVRYA